MISRIVEVANPARLFYKNRQLQIEGDSPGTVPLDDLGILVIDNPQVTLTAPLLAACADAGIAVVICDERHTPNGILLPMEGHSLHAKTLRGQIAASEPTKKRLWQSIVQAKIREQAALLVELFEEDAGLPAIADRVKTGDAGNVEGGAARIYWLRLFGSSFIRDRDMIGTNSMLNYGYAVIRAAVARAVVGAGLHPAIGLHHSNQYNAFALADDLIEPLRPLVDRAVVEILAEYGDVDELTPEVKHHLLRVLTLDVGLSGARYPLTTALEYYAANTRRCLLGESRKLACPGR